MTRPMLTQREAAAACGVSRTTIRRRREAGDLPGAVQDEARGWLIPVEDLLTAGFRLNAPAGPDTPAAASSAEDGGNHRQEHGDDQGDSVAGLRAELERMRHEHALAVADAEHGRRLAEAEAGHLREQLSVRAEQLAAQAAHIADLQQTVRALMPAPERPELGPAVPGQAQSGHHPGPEWQGPEAAGGERARWWRRT
ncbi:AlpA family transcriptional regulator [Streptomyces sp. CAI 127]|uniref:helix-turn-helix transcriptional regulator n=1 Tax=Streptomyces sp. CAI 127 TaxID=1076397 RepID=UPI0015879C76|nr:helix-turn-helix domain-containing protein [Streptomyces sp. CAI 127]NUW04320.1 helix-turn-helix domain-containing protein [Streptomyces sp. CAI 127]